MFILIQKMFADTLLTWEIWSKSLKIEYLTYT